jgi:hypothetical protein
MRTLYLPLWIALLGAQTVFSQTQKFDIGTFVPPRGWSQS